MAAEPEIEGEIVHVAVKSRVLGKIPVSDLMQRYCRVDARCAQGRNRGARQHENCSAREFKVRPETP